MVLALTSGLASAAVTDVSVNQVVENFGSPSAVSFEAINNNFASGFDSTNFDGIARNCGLSLYGYNGLLWSTASVTVGSTVDGLLSFNNSVFASVPASGDTEFWGYEYDDGVGQKYYGYAQFTGLGTGPSSSRDFVFDRYAFEDSSGTGITVVPEPGAAAGVLGLAAGLAALKRRRRS